MDGFRSCQSRSAGKLSSWRLPPCGGHPQSSHFAGRKSSELAVDRSVRLIPLGNHRSRRADLPLALRHELARWRGVVIRLSRRSRTTLAITRFEAAEPAKLANKRVHPAALTTDCADSLTLLLSQTSGPACTFDRLAPAHSAGVIFVCLLRIRRSQESQPELPAFRSSPRSALSRVLRK